MAEFLLAGLMIAAAVALTAAVLAVGVIWFAEFGVHRIRKAFRRLR